MALLEKRTGKKNRRMCEAGRGLLSY